MMIKKILLSLTVLFSAQAFAVNLPNEFTVTEHWLSWTTTFDIETKDTKFGTVHRKLLSWTPQYHLKSTDDELLAIGKMRFFNLLPFFDVTDAEGVPLGTLEQKFTWFFPTFEIVSPTGQKLATASLNFWGTKYTLTDIVKPEFVLAEMTRPFFRLKNNWTVSIKNPEELNNRNLHPHMLLVMLAYQVDREYWEAAHRRHERQHQRDSERARQEYTTAGTASRATLAAHKENKETLALFDKQEKVADNLLKKLNVYAEVATLAEPTEDDFATVEALVTDQISDDDAFVQTTLDLIPLFESSELTDGQKAALYHLLKNRLS